MKQDDVDDSDDVDVDERCRRRKIVGACRVPLFCEIRRFEEDKIHVKSAGSANSAGS